MNGSNLMRKSTDSEIRRAFHRKKLHALHTCPDTLIIDELGIAHGRNRIDVAVINGCIHGYEIKSAKDTLSRLPQQIENYSKCLERLSVIAAPEHIQEASKIIPDWCGLVEADKGARGGIRFRTIRRSQKNISVDFVAMAHFLWRSEVIEILSELGAPGTDIKGPRVQLYRKLSEFIPTSELSRLIKREFMARKNWRDLQQPASCGD